MPKKAVPSAPLPAGVSEKAKKAKSAALENVNGEVGASGTRLFGGRIYEEYNQKLDGLNGLEKYEEMRTSDAQVQSTLLAMELPIRGTHWFVEPGETVGEGGEKEVTPEDLAIAEFVEDALFRRMEGTFDDFLRQALTMLPFGFSVFEKVWKEEEGTIYIKKLAQRLARSVDSWHLREDGKRDVVQTLPMNDEGKPYSVTIPAEKCVVFTYRREGDNFAGRSVLRSAYKHWYIKDQLYKFDAVKHERQAVGVPVITLPTGARETDKDEAATILKNLRASEQGYVVLPSPDWKFEFANMGTGTTSDVKDSVAHHNREISKNILAQFLELGASGSSGSYSLSQDQSGIFMLSLTAIAKHIAETVNRELIPELVELNFDVPDNRNFPTLKFGRLGDVDFAELSTALATLASAGLITPDEDTEAHVRNVLDLPKKSEESAEEEDMDETEEDGTAEEMDALAEEDDSEEAAAQDSAPDGNDAADSEKELADLEKELASLEACERTAQAAMFAEAYGDGAESAIFRAPVSDEARKNISEALKEYWRRKGKKTTQDVAQAAGRHRANAQDAAQKIAKRSEDFKKAVAPLKSKLEEIRKLKDAIPAGKRDPAARSKIRAMASQIRSEIRAMRSQRDADVSEARTVRSNALQSAKAAKAELSARRKALDGVIKKIREDAAANNATRSASIRLLSDQARANSAAIKDAYEKAKAESAGKSAAAKREIMKNAKALAQGIRQQSEGLREAARKLRDEAKAERTGALAKTDAIRRSAKYSEPVIGDEAARALGFSDASQMRDFLESKRIIDHSVALNVQTRG